MGASYLSTTIPFSTEAELHAHFHELHREDLTEFGTDPYSGSWATITDLDVKPDKEFRSAFEADDYLSDTPKRAAVAVVLVETELPARVRARIGTLRKRASELRSRHGEPGVKTRSAFSGKPGKPAWELALDRACIDRVRKGTSKTRSCAGCGSAIAVAHIASVDCPVCGLAGFLLTKADRARAETHRRRLQSIETKIRSLEVEADRIEAEARASAPVARKFWYIGGFAAS